MKKMGFTLSEIIVALSIVAVVAVISAPLITSLIPDKNKVTVLKVNKILTDVTQELLQDPGYYNESGVLPEPFNGWDCEGLGCISRPLLPEFQENQFSGLHKYSYLLASKLNTVNDPVLEEGIVTFDTIDGLRWSIDSGFAFPRVGVLGVQYNVTVDVNGDEDPNQTYEDSTRPDCFSFRVDNRGNITGADPLTRAYLENPHKLNDIQADLARAAEIAEE